MSTPFVSAELRVNRANTLAFIGAHPADLVLIPQRKARTASGGFEVVTDPPRPSQRVRIIDMTTSRSGPVAEPQRTIDGIDRSVQYMLLARWDAVMAVYDTWTDDEGLRWELMKLFPSNGYEERAMVTRYGE